ncbi:MAG: DUF4382 domain-containing protein [Bacteroidetes bacterium]|nr:DUF4382 domain-containing protein [Bacteroidota bacterium]
MKTSGFMAVKAKMVLLAASIIMFGACHKDLSQQTDDHGNHSGSGNTSVHVFLTDDPSLTFDNVFIDIQKVEIKAEDSGEVEHEHNNEAEEDGNDQHGSTSGGWVTLDIRAGVYDILNFRNGLDTLLASGQFTSANELKKVRITLGNNNSVVFNGQTFPLFIKDNENMIVIKLDNDFSGAGSLDQFDFSLDFDAGRSISRHGDRFELRAEVKPFRKEKAGSIEGRVLPADAAAVVMAINGTDTATAKPEREGEFKIVGLKEGTYSLLYHATANNYQDTTVLNVAVQKNEDTHVADVTLHK